MIEKVNPAHPDKVADRIAGAIVDLAYQKETEPKIAVEVLIGHGACHIIIESSCAFTEAEIAPVVTRIAGEMRLDLGNCPVRVFQAEAPHTDDSTLIEVPGEKALILGDCTGGTFPDWDFDEVLGCRLAETIREIGPEVCLPGHWTPLDPEIVIQDLLNGEG